MSSWWPCEVSPWSHTPTQLFDFNCVAVNLLWMMSKCIKKKGWVVTVSVLTHPLCNLGGLYQGFACWTPHYPNLFSPPPILLFTVLCLVALCIAIVFSAPCHLPPSSLSVNICSTEATLVASSCLAPNDISHQPQLCSSLLKQQETVQWQQYLLFQSCGSILFVACW